MRAWRHIFPARITSGAGLPEQKWMLSAQRDDGELFYAHQWGMQESVQAVLDTFLRDDCTCAAGSPRCTFHAETFADDPEGRKRDMVLMTATQEQLA